ncbi:hypothetical protein Tsubulata_043823 [Turnera subulata]|uniref:CCHC-type domain-containing protein n=1 Tax=Turnera subulata TaxID=218843 RepID=A0A9Q0G2T5_9ROSI|nr:hypothetical protein Tsubulata_043823 [Turnera subulata]
MSSSFSPVSPLSPACPPPPGKPPDLSSSHQDAAEGQVSAMHYDKPSFLDTLLKDQERAKEKSSMVDLIEEQMVSLTFLDGDRLRPSFALDSDYYQRLCAPWTNTLILKLLGRTIGYKAMHTRLMQLWKPGASGPMVYDHYLTVRQWFPEFRPECDHLGKTMAWISLPGLPLMYYDDDLLITFASAIGKPIKIDSNTSEATRALYPQMCVEIDFGLPLVPVVHIQDEAFKVQYEGLHTICLNCGRYGHTIIQCQFDQPDVPIELAEGVSPENYMEVTHAVDDFQVPFRPPAPPPVSKRAQFREWMVVARSLRPPPRNRPVGDNS